MKLSEWFKARSGQELMMIAVVAMLLVMIATRWAYISRPAMLPATVFFPTAATGSALTPAPKIP